MLNQDHIQLIKTQLEDYSEFIVGLSQDVEKGNKGLRGIEFCIQPLEDQKQRKKITLLTLENEPYSITSREKVVYPRKWQELCEIAQKEGFQDPFEYISLGGLDDYSKNLPNAVALLSGFCKYAKAFQEARVQITHIGRTTERAPKPLNQGVIARFTELTRSFYTGHTVGDINPELR